MPSGLTKAQEKRANAFAAKYRLSMAQKQQYLKLEVERWTKISNLNSTSLPEKERSEKAGAIHKDFNAREDAILTPVQLAQLETARRNNNGSERTARKLVHEYDVKSKQMVKAKAPKAEIAGMRATHQTKIVSLVGQQRADQMLNKLKVDKKAAYNKQNNVALTKAQTEGLMALRKQKEADLKAVNASNVPDKQKATKRRQINKQYEANITKQVGAAQAAQINKAQQTNADKNFKARLGINDSQLQRYKDAINNRTVQLADLRGAKNLTQAEKDAIAKEIKQTTEKELQAILTPAQYKKLDGWNKAKEAAQAKVKEKRQAKASASAKSQQIAQSHAKK